MMSKRVVTPLAALLLLLGGCASAGTRSPEEALDRRVMPAPGPTPSYDFPDIQRFTLSNGLGVWLVERRNLPLVSMQLLLNAGATVESAERAGIASLTAAMLTQGTTSRTATDIADEIEYLAASLTASTGRETAVVNLNTLSDNLADAFRIFADVVMNPAFREEDWTRVRNQRIAAIAQARDQPPTVASEEFSRRIYGATHPFGRPLQGSRASVEGLETEALREFHATHYRPRNANLIVVGDVGRAELASLLERELGAWSGAAPAAVAAPEIPGPQQSTRIFLIDRPGAAQSEIRIGHLGIDRAHRDYFAILVMNAILGGQFSSRINVNLREDKGYTYGASSFFQTARFPGPFIAAAAVQTVFTTESLIEFMRELQDVRGPRPITQQELEFARTSIIRGEPLSLETNAQIANRIQQLVHFGLPMDYFDRYNEQVAAVSLQDVHRVAREYLDPERLAIVVVGDRAAIEPGLRTLAYPIEIVTLDS